ncbi:GAF domain-containing protein [Deinococcus arcticus]|uniref:histidine kinase n=1 Tax=Deinococcus arcticus TaxID=2136176 RepID=A0A2T3W9Q2_9DEIO|nr:GAF domain-containing protein [Deinococcus arcticus]PTA68552.1 histidine kinase [Deinococcus arcticus]
MTPVHELSLSALASLLAASDDALFVLDEHGRFVYANDAAGAVVGRRGADLSGLSLETDFAHAFSPRWLSESRRARAEGRRVEYDAFNPALGGWVRVQVTPHGSHLAVQLRDVSAQYRSAALQQITAALAQAGTLAEVVQVTLRETAAAAGAAMAALVRPTADGEHLELVGDTGYPPELRARFARFPLSLDIPPCEVARSGQATYVEGDTFDARYPGSVGVRAAQTRSMAALPLSVDGQLWGVLALSFRDLRQFHPHEREFFEALLGQCAQALSRVRAQAQLQEEAEALRRLNHSGQLVAAELDLGRMVQAVTDAGVELSGAQFGAFFYNVVGEGQESYMLYTLSGVPREAFDRFPMPRNTQIFAPTFTAQGVVRSDDITQDPRYGHSAPHHGMPAGHLPVRSYLAVPVVSRSGEVLGGLFFGHAETGVFTARAEELLQALAAQAAVGMDNARLYQQLQDSHRLLEARVEARTHELEAQAAALEAFVRFTEAAGTTTEVLTLAREAMGVFRRFFAQCSAAYYERDGELWRAQVWTEDLEPAVIQSITAGVPAEAPTFADAARTRAPVFVDGWDPAHEQVAATEAYGTVALYPMVVEDEVVGLLAVGLKNTRQWGEHSRAVVRSTGRSLNLSLERAAVSLQLQKQRDALQARTQALEAFEGLTRNLTLEADSYSLITRAQHIMLSLLPEGYSIYWEREGDTWQARTQLGDLHSAELQRQVDAGFPYETTRTVRLPFETGEPLYQDEYDRTNDGLDSTVAHISATASLPVRVGDRVQGVIVVGLFGARRWTATDRAVLATVMRSVGLTLEGAEHARALQERTRDLERSNADLERFAYVASHDLQEPLRTIASFAELIERRYGERLDDRGRQYLQFVTRGAERMKVLIDDLLVFSRLNVVREPLVPLALAGPLQDALDSLHGAAERSGARVTWGALPEVLGVRSELAQLFQNLLGNAIKFRREGASPQIEVQARPAENGGWQIEVRDNGIGFEVQYAERIFEMFQRLHGRDRFEGTGMGLAIVRKILDHHGGQIWASSVPGQGSTFTFTLQAAPGAAEPPA